MLKDISHLFPQTQTHVEYYINHCVAEHGLEYNKDEIIFTVIKHLCGVRFHHRVYTTEHWCSELKMSNEDTLIWVIKYGDVLPRKLTERLTESHQ